MTERTLPTATDERVIKPVGELKAGDWIAPGHMIGGGSDTSVVLLAYTFQQRGMDWVLLAYRQIGMDYPEIEYLPADTKMALAAIYEIPEDAMASGREIDNGDASAVVPVGVDGHAEFTGRATVPEQDCGWMTPSGPCHLVRDHPLFPFGPREDSGHISQASTEANRARLAELEGGE